MTDVARLVNFIDDTFAIVRTDLGATLRQLEQWMAGFKSAASGAPPPTATGSTADQSVKLTSVEAGAMSVDDARRATDRVGVLVGRLVRDLAAIRLDVHGDALPPPADRLPSRLAFIQWHINQLARAPHVHRSCIGQLDDVSRNVVELHQITTSYRPAPPSTKLIDACHAHEAAGLDAEISSTYRRLHLCRWCGDFRTTYGVNPPPKLVKLNDRGIYVTTTMVRAAGIRKSRQSA